MTTHVCPFCKHENKQLDDLDDEALSNTSTTECAGCGRRLRVRQKLHEMTCDECGHSDDCPFCIDSIAVERLCPVGHCKWAKTLCDDIEKCTRCFDIKRIIPTPSPSLP